MINFKKGRSKGEFNFFKKQYKAMCEENNN